MTKEIFIEEKKKISDELIALRDREAELIKKYIDSNKEFEEGEKVIITTKEGLTEFGFISKVNTNHLGDIKYDVLKQKKDGTPSQHKMFIWYTSKINKIT